MATSIQYGQLHLYPRTRLLSVPLPQGDRGVAVTIAFMRMAAQWGETDPQVRQFALSLVRDVPKNDAAGEIQAVFDWVKENIRFRGELDETVQTPEVTIRYQAGDCDDHSVLNAGLLGSIGYQWDFKTVGLGGSDFTHVYLVVLNHATGAWVVHPDPMVAVDTTVDEPLGWEPPGIQRAALWPGSSQRVRKPEAAQIINGSGSDLMRRGRAGQQLGWATRGIRRLGDDPTAADQISEVLTASTPIAISAIQAARGGNNYPGYSYPGYSQYGVNVGFTTPPDVPLTQRTWFWPAMFGLGGLLIWSMGRTQSRGR